MSDISAVPVERDEFEFVPETVEDCWRHAWDGDTDAERTETLENLSALIDYCFNPSDDDAAQSAILERAVLAAASYIASLPCTCAPGDEDGPCGRCSALGRWHDVRCER